jgi:hypothetical protein
VFETAEKSGVVIGGATQSGYVWTSLDVVFPNTSWVLLENP